jgi:hypothetical protein
MPDLAVYLFFPANARNDVWLLFFLSVAALPFRESGELYEDP